MPIIQSIYAREILDSRGFPTIETEVLLESGEVGVAGVPSGASTGSFEACELRDGGDRILGKGVLKAVENVNNIIAEALIGECVCDQRLIDKALIDLDGTENKTKLGANAILSVSLAVLQAAAKFYQIPLYNYIGGIANTSLPCPMMNILNGGVHADNKISVQEFMIVPFGKKSFKDHVMMCATIYHNLKKTLKSKGLNSNVGDEGGVAPNLSSTKEALDLIIEAITSSGYSTEHDVKIALDVAATELYVDGRYLIDGKSYSPTDVLKFYENLISEYPIMSIEDPLAEDDWKTWKDLTGLLGRKVMIVGDDLFVTNKNRLQKGIDENSANSILIKLNQIGTVSETLDTINLAVKNGFNVIISHRSGETNDSYISDLAVGVGAGFIKTGAPSRGERVAKYNQLIRIEEDLMYNDGQCCLTEG